MPLMKTPTSCDTFVCLPPLTEGNVIIFGKNSDRPSKEVQEVVYFPSKSYNEGDKVQCTYIEIDQAVKTASIILSKPSWMWGGEMGANEYGVCIGNEAVWTNVEHLEDINEERLLGMDFLRLGLERGTTALEAVKVITCLLEKHGQGGPCSDTQKGFTYHNSFLITDPKEAFVLETAGRFWAAEKIESGFRNISNSLSIGTKIDMMSNDLKQEANRLGLWNKDGKEFHFAHAFGTGGACDRYSAGQDLLNQKTKQVGKFNVESMMQILRDEESGINMGGYGDGSASTASQVSILRWDSQGPSIHWFTATPDPKRSIFKPFVFTCGNTQEEMKDTTSPEIVPDPAKIVPRFKNQVDRRHPLYKVHESVYLHKIKRNKEIQNAMSCLEKEMIERAQKGGLGLYNEAVQEEIRIYSSK